MLEIKNVVKQFGPQMKTVDDISLHLQRGVVGLDWP